MDMMVRFSIFFIFSGAIYAQKINEEQLINNYFITYKKNTDTDLIKACEAINKAYLLSVKIKNNSWIAKTAYGVGYCNYLYEKDSISEIYLDKAIIYSKKSKDQETLVKSLNVKGIIYNFKNRKVEALEYFHESLKYSTRSILLYHNTASVLNNIADIYVTEHDTLNAKKYYHEAIKIQRKNRLEKSLSNTYNSLGVLYMDTNKDSALYYINNSLILAINNKLENELVDKYLNLGIIYLNFNDVNNYDKAKYNLIKALKLAYKHKTSRYKFQGNLYLGIYYKKAERDFITSKNYLDTALSLINNNKDKEYNLALYKELSDVYYKLSDFKNAYKFKSLENDLKNQISDTEKNKQIHEIQTKFDVERKDFQIDLLHLQQKNQEIENRWIIIVSLISILGLLSLGILYRSKQRKKNLLQLQQSEVKRMQDVVKSQDNERNRIAKELHDGVGNKLAVFKNILYQDVFTQEDIDYLQTGTKNLMKEIREISHNLSLSILNQKTALELVVELVETFQRKTTINIELIIYPNEAFDLLDEEQKIHLYRILQEILHNIDKHADAQNVSITVTKHEMMFSLIIEDDGKGFDIKETKQGIGILNMNERINLIGGILTVDSVLGNGTTIIITLNEEDKNRIG